MSGRRPEGWTVLVEKDAAAVLEDMRAQGFGELRGSVVRFLRALAIEAGAAVDAGKPPPGLSMGEDRYNVDIPGEPIILSYSVHREWERGRAPAAREVRISDLVWVH